MGWSGPNKATKTTLIRVFPPCAIVRVADREALSISVNVATSAREGVVPPPAMI